MGHLGLEEGGGHSFFSMVTAVHMVVEQDSPDCLQQRRSFQSETENAFQF